MCTCVLTISTVAGGSLSNARLTSEAQPRQSTRTIMKPCTSYHPGPGNRRYRRSGRRHSDRQHENALRPERTRFRENRSERRIELFDLGELTHPEVRLCVISPLLDHSDHSTLATAANDEPQQHTDEDHPSTNSADSATPLLRRNSERRRSTKQQPLWSPRDLTVVTTGVATHSSALGSGRTGAGTAYDPARSWRCLLRISSIRSNSMSLIL